MFLWRYSIEHILEALMDYYTTSELAEKWGISRRRVTTLCIEGRLEGAILKGKTWLIPIDVVKPVDLRRKKESK